MKLGTIYLLSQQLENAQLFAKSVIEKEPLNLDALILLADASNKAKDVQSSLDRLIELEEHFSDQVKYHLILGSLYNRKNETEKAELAFNRAISLNPNSSKAHSMISSLHLSRGEIKRAEDALRKAAELSDPTSSTQLKWIDFNIQQKKFKEAKELTNTIINIEPKSLPALVRLAKIYFIEAENDKSLELIDKILKIDSQHHDALLLKGKIKYVTKDIDSAILQFKLLVKLHEQSTSGHYFLALAFLQNAEHKKATAQFAKVLEIDPHHFESILLLAELNLQAGDYDATIHALEPLVAKNLNSARIYPLLGLAYRSNKEPIKAIGAYHNFVELVPENPQARYLLGLAYDEDKQRSKAIEAYEKALELAPAYQLPLDQLTVFDLEDKGYEAALIRIEKQIKLAPKAPGPRYSLGKIYFNENQLEKAEEAFLKS